MELYLQFDAPVMLPMDVVGVVCLKEGGLYPHEAVKPETCVCVCVACVANRPTNLT